MKKSTIYLFSWVLLALSMSSCTKSDMAELNTTVNKVRIYDDTLPDPRNHAIRIAAANGRLLMTYGRSFERWIFVNGSVIYAPPPTNIWMLTDNDGNLIKRDTIPTGLSIGDVLAMPDNSFLIVTFIGDYAVQGSYGGVQLIRIDPNGVMGAVDTLVLPTSEPVMILGSIHLSLSQNGNAILYFLYSGTNGFGGAFVGEMNAQRDFLWEREFLNYTITDCMAEPEGGYFMTGKIFDLMSYSSDAFIMKTNATGDSLWNRIINCVDIGNGLDNGIGQIVSAGNGNYRFGFCDWEVGFTGQNTYVYEFNHAGEFLDTAIIGMSSSYMFQKDKEDLFLLNSVEAVFGNVTNQFNTTYAILDADMTLTSKAVFQDQTCDMLNSGCRTSDGSIACFGLTQSYDKRYFKPELIIVK